ncbi:MAG: alpha/beta hydrolase [Acidimicrobiales bacterium]|nr:alpha/beta hydrolase [Acidimicrobiales bacterium]
MTVRVAAFVAAALIAGACGGDDSSAPPLITVPDGAAASSTTGEPSSTTEAEPSTVTLPAISIAQVDCPESLVRGDGVALSCGVVTVPIDRLDGADGSTRITIAMLAGYDPGFDTPAAVLQGGPGGASTDLAAWFPQQPFTQVFVDQRGTGFAGPNFDCTEILDALPRLLGSPFDEAGVLAAEAYADCARRLDQDIVLQHTESESHAGDVVDVMRELGYDRWTAYGVSYGSTIGLELLRDEPQGLVGVVLDGVYSPQLDTNAAVVESAGRALDLIDARCRAETICRQYVADGSVRDTLERVMDELDANPMTVSLHGNRTGLPSTIELVLDGRRVAELLFPLMYHESLVRYLPAIIGGLYDRDAASVEWLAHTGARFVIAAMEGNDEGTYFAVQCHDRLPFVDGTAEIDDRFATAVAASPLEEACPDWERDAAPAIANEAVTSDVPTLLLSGTFDPITPPSYAEETATGLANATVVEQDGRGHGIWFGNTCIAGIVQQFVADPLRELDVACAAEPVPVEWARP